MIALATSLAEQQMIDGTASSPKVVTFYLKLATSREASERKRIELETNLEARTEQIGSQARSEELYAEAINAFRSYSGLGGEEEYID